MTGRMESQASLSVADPCAGHRTSHPRHLNALFATVRVVMSSWAVTGDSGSLCRRLVMHLPQRSVQSLSDVPDGSSTSASFHASVDFGLLSPWSHWNLARVAPSRRAAAAAHASLRLAGSLAGSM